MTGLLFALGAILVAAPFVAVSILGAKALGFWRMVAIWGLAVAIMASIVGGTYLIGAAS